MTTVDESNQLLHQTDGNRRIPSEKGPKPADQHRAGLVAPKPWRPTNSPPQQQIPLMYPLLLFTQPNFAELPHPGVDPVHCPPGRKRFDRTRTSRADPVEQLRRDLDQSCTGRVQLRWHLHNHGEPTSPGDRGGSEVLTAS
ncbi:hypothetical protein GCM10009804_73070 [Kribbella hippodromi]|uniref:Uncharacterized protein n=1 Tax=Kribbella hippodromi TaxID=434347 RepID=A0ABN2EFW9_9ACTN